jgi:hypothetical protein
LLATTQRNAIIGKFHLILHAKMQRIRIFQIAICMVSQKNDERGRLTARKLPATGFRFLPEALPLRCFSGV